MPAPSWFQKLRRRRKKKQSPCRSGQGDGAASSANNNCPSPNRASYYFPSADGGGERLRHVVVATEAAAALDVRVDVVHRRAGDARAPAAAHRRAPRRLGRRRHHLGRHVAVHQSAGVPREALRPAGGGGTTTTAAAPTSPSRQRRWLYESLVVVKASSDPERELAESMAEMVLANGVRESDDLALNAAEHRRVWLRLGRHEP